MNPPNDLDINRHIRKVLVKHWVDLGRLSIRTTKGKVMIRGFLDRISGMQDRLSTPVVEAMFAEIEKIYGVVNTNVDLSNWIRNEGKWTPMDKGKKAPGQTSEAHPSSSFDIR